MVPVPVRFGPNSDTAASTGGGGTIIENGYIEPTQGGKTPFTVNTDPGLVLFSNVSTGQLGRGMYIFGNTNYSVFGESLFGVNVVGTPTLIGSVPGSLPVNFSQNQRSPNNEIVITTDARVYVLANNVLTQVTDPDLPSGVTSTTHLNGYIFYLIADGRIFSSDILNAGSINALNFDTAQRSPDPGVRVGTVGEEIWIWGTQSLEVFRYIGGTGFPLERLQGVTVGEGGGSTAKNAHVIMDNAPYWINDKRQVVRAQGYTPVRVSTSAVERDIEATVKLGQQDQITGFTYAMNGHQFYGIRSPQWCWVLDAMTGDWHRKRSYQSNTWICGAYVYAFGKHIVQDFTDGKLYEMTQTARDEAGQPLILKLTSQNVNSFPNYFICSAFYLDLQGGTGLAVNTTDGIDPQVIIRVSRDGGKTFGFLYQQSIGQQADWAHAIILRRIGYCPPAGLVFEVSLSSPVERAVFQGAADVEVLSR